MDPRDLFLAVLAVLYVTDLWWLLPRRAVVFRGYGRRYRWVSASRSGFALGSRRILLSFGELPFGLAFATDFPALYRDGDARVFHTWPLFAPDAQSVERRAVEEELEAEGAHLRDRAGEIARYSSPAAARFAATSSEDVIVGDPAALSERVDQFRRSTRGLRSFCTLLFLFGFVAAPLALRGVVRLPWPTWLAIYFWLVLVVQFLFFQLHRDLYPEARGERWGKVAAMLVSPPEAMIACYSLSRGLLAGHHPLVVAKALSSEREFARLAELSARGALVADPFVQARIDSVLRSLGVESETLMPPPKPEPDCATYCPRCLSQFTDDRSLCPDCITVEVSSFGSHGEPPGSS